MKKLYIQPNTLIGESFASSIICTSNPNPGSAGVIVGGGDTGETDKTEVDNGIGSTDENAGDGDFTVGAKRRGFYTGF